MCVCKNKLVGRIIGECTSVINETMINNRNNIANGIVLYYNKHFYWIIFSTFICWNCLLLRVCLF